METGANELLIKYIGSHFRTEAEPDRMVEYRRGGDCGRTIQMGRH